MRWMRKDYYEDDGSKITVGGFPKENVTEHTNSDVVDYSSLNTLPLNKRLPAEDKDEP